MDASALDPEHRREIWREEQITARVSEGKEYTQGELKRGEVVGLADFGDQASVVIEDDAGRFDVVDASKGTAEDLQRGDSVRVSRVGETSLEKQNGRERGLDR